MTRKTYCLLMPLVVFLAFVCSAALAFAQESNKKDQVSVPILLRSYRLLFVLSEMEDGKKINTRSFGMLVKEAPPHEPAIYKLRVGDRIPIVTGGEVPTNPAQIQYLDIGVNIDCKLYDEENGSLNLDFKAALTGLTAAKKEVRPVNQPTESQMQAEGNVILTVGQTAILTSMDDPTSKRQFSLEVTATKVK